MDELEYNHIVDFWKNKKISTASKLEALLESYSVNFAFHSGKIENEKITYYDTHEIFSNDGVVSYTGDLRTLFEIQNSKKAYEYMLEAFEQKLPLTEELVKKFQKLLTMNTYDEYRYKNGERPGEYKIGDYVTGKEEVGALAEDVPAEMSELLAEVADIEGVNPLTAAAYFHAKFENIHPFSDGNGRTGRLLMNYLLLINNHPPITIHEEDRRTYYDALHSFDKNLEIKSLEDFLSLQLIKTWQRYLDRTSRERTCRLSLNDCIKDTQTHKKE